MSVQVRPLNNVEITDKLARYGIKILFVPYSSLVEYQNLDEIMPCLLLYELHDPVGHWTVLFRNEEGINYFDPLGFRPDKLLQTNFDHPMGRELMNADYTHLLDLLARDGHPIVWNEEHLQDIKSNTCGYWSGMRLLTQNLTNKQFNGCWKGYTSQERDRKVVSLYDLF